MNPTPTAYVLHNPKELLTKQKNLKLYTLIAMLFVSVCVVANIVTQKIVPIGKHLILSAGDFVYPLSYLFSVTLTEVYGYAMSRRVIWGTFVCNMVVSVLIIFCIWLPSSAVWSGQEQFAAVLGCVPRMLIGSFMAFLTGEFISSYIVAKSKVFLSGRYLLLRTIGSFLIGQLIDSTVFVVIAFGGVLSWHDMWVLNFSAYGFKILYQALLTPGVCVIARFLKKHERIDIFDRNTNFNPFYLGLK